MVGIFKWASEKFIHKSVHSSNSSNTKLLSFCIEFQQNSYKCVNLFTLWKLFIYISYIVHMILPTIWCFCSNTYHFGFIYNCNTFQMKNCIKFLHFSNINNTKLPEFLHRIPVASFPGRRRNGLATSASSNCYFRCLKVGSTNQISERSHMTTVKPNCVMHWTVAVTPIPVQ